MVTTFLISLFLMNGTAPGDSLQSFRKQLASNLYISMRLPPNSDAGDTCYHYTELLKVEIDKASKIVSIDLSDSAPNWMKEDLSGQKKGRYLNRKLDSLALKLKLRNCVLIFPLIFESEDFPCGEAPKKRSYKEDYFQFAGKNLSGNILFGEQIKLIYSVRYISKTMQ